MSIVCLVLGHKFEKFKGQVFGAPAQFTITAQDRWMMTYVENAMRLNIHPCSRCGTVAVVKDK